LDPLTLLQDGTVVQCQSENPASLLLDRLPELFPSVPALESRVVDFAIPNPFAYESETPRHASLEKRRASKPGDVAVNGYIKFRLRAVSQSTSTHGQLQIPQPAPKFRQQFPRTPFERVPVLPPHFGRGIKLDSMDEKLLKFCKTRRLSFVLEAHSCSRFDRIL
jgi:hypothetical protein